MKTLVEVSGVSKKFCRTLNHTMLYGVTDLARSFLGLNQKTSLLRKGEFWAVNDVSFELKPGECLGIIGPNGSGKSTLLKMLNGIFMPDRGSIAIRGRVGALIEVGAGFHPLLTGRENIYVNGAILGMSNKEIDGKLDDILDFAEIDDFIDSPVKHYSSGMYVRLGFAVAAHLQPDVLVIDEILAVGDLGFRMKCFNHILDLKRKGTAIILVTHSMTDVSRVCDRIAVIQSGALPFLGEVNHGICKYQEITQLRRGDFPHQDVRHTSPFKIKSVKVFNNLRVECTNFKTRDDIFVEIVLTASTILKNARLVATIESSIGPLGSFATPYKSFTFDIIPTETTIDLKLIKIPLLVGTYYVSLGLNGPERGEAYDFKQQAVHFKIIDAPMNSFGFGLGNIFEFNHSWEITKKE